MESHETLIPVATVGFKLALLFIGEIQSQLRRAVVSFDSTLDVLLLKLKNLPHRIRLSVSSLRQQSGRIASVFLRTLLKMWEQLMDIFGGGLLQLLAHDFGDWPLVLLKQGGIQQSHGFCLGFPAVWGQLALTYGWIDPASRDGYQLLVETGSAGTVKREPPN